MQSINRTMGAVEWSLLIILSILWGGSFFFIGVAVNALPPLTIVAARVGLAALALNMIASLLGYSMVLGRQLWMAILGMSLINNVVPFTLIAWGQAHIASGLAAILIATTPFFTIIVAHFFTTDEKISAKRLLGIAIGFGGVVFLIDPATLQGLGTNTFAQLAILGAAIFYAFSAVYGRRFHRAGMAPLVTATGQITVSSVILIPLALVVDRPWALPAPGWEVWGAVLGLALLSTALGYILYFRLLATAGATNSLLVAFLIPVSAILLGTFILGEQLSWRELVGMAILGLGLAVIDGRLLRRFVTRSHRGEGLVLSDSADQEAPESGPPIAGSVVSPTTRAGTGTGNS